jgi:hypothetical protein
MQIQCAIPAHQLQKLFCYGVFQVCTTAHNLARTHGQVAPFPVYGSVMPERDARLELNPNEVRQEPRMNTKRQRPSAEQWAKLDTALEGLRECTPPGSTPPLSREIVRRAEALRAALDSGWRIRDLAALFKEAAGIDVSATTIQTALRQALEGQATESKRARAKRPRKRTESADGPALTSIQATPEPETDRVQPAELAKPGIDNKVDATPSRELTPLGSALTQGATKRGMR